MPAKPSVQIDPELAEDGAARAHDDWFRAEVEAAVREADSPGTVWVSNEDAKHRLSRRRAELASDAPAQNTSR
jgi:hypothetical protein